MPVYSLSVIQHCSLETAFRCSVWNPSIKHSLKTMSFSYPKKVTKATNVDYYITTKGVVIKICNRNCAGRNYSARTVLVFLYFICLCYSYHLSRGPTTYSMLPHLTSTGHYSKHPGQFRLSGEKWICWQLLTFPNLFHSCSTRISKSKWHIKIWTDQCSAQQEL